MLQGTSLGEMFGHNLQYLLKGIVLMSVLGFYLDGKGFVILAGEYLKCSVEGSVPVECYVHDEIAFSVAGPGPYD